MKKTLITLAAFTLAAPVAASEKHCRSHCNIFKTVEGNDYAAAMAAISGIDFNESTDRVQGGIAIGGVDGSTGIAIGILAPLGSVTNLRGAVAMDTDGGNAVWAVGLTTAF